MKRMTLKEIISLRARAWIEYENATTIHDRRRFFDLALGWDLAYHTEMRKNAEMESK